MMMIRNANHDIGLTKGTFALILSIYNVGDQFHKSTKN
jgi:hypothetical protein